MAVTLQEWFVQGLSTEWAGHITITIASAVLFALRKKIKNWAPMVRPDTNQNLLYLIFIALVFGGVIAMFYRAFVPEILISDMGFTLYLFIRLRDFWRVGFLSASRKITSGIDYRTALGLCNNELLFLGLGAGKLTSESEFVDAVSRCHRIGEPRVRFLLISPDHPILKKAEMLAQKRDKSYSDTVKESLSKLSKMRADRALNIQIKIYNKSQPTFRMMFIDDSFCLLSYYVFGEGDGSELPQILIKKFDVNQRDVDSFYYPLRQYFMELWDDAEDWDGRKYLEAGNSEVR